MMVFSLKSNTIFIAVLIQLMFAFLLIALSRHYQIRIDEMWNQNGSYLRGVIEKIAADQKNELDHIALKSDVYSKIQIAYEEYYTINRSQLFSMDVNSKDDYRYEFEKYQEKIREILSREAKVSEMYDIVFQDDFFHDRVITSHDEAFDQKHANRLNYLVEFSKKEREINSVFYYADDENTEVIYLCKIFDIPPIGAINPGFLIWRKLICDHINFFFPKDDHFEAFCSSTSFPNSGRNLVNYPIQNSQGDIGNIQLFYFFTDIHKFFVFNLLFISFLFLICCYLFFYKLFIYPHDQLMDTFTKYLQDSDNVSLLNKHHSNNGFFDSMASVVNKSLFRYQDITGKLYIQKSLIRRFKKDFEILETWCNQFLTTMQRICNVDPDSLDALHRKALQSKFKALTLMATWKPPILKQNQAEKHSSSINSPFDLFYYIRRSLKAHPMRWYMTEPDNMPKEIVLDVDAFTDFWDNFLETDFEGLKCGNEGLVSATYEEKIGRIDIYLRVNLSRSFNGNRKDLIREIEQCSQIITAGFFSKSFMAPLFWEVQGDHIDFKFGIEQKFSDIPSEHLPRSFTGSLSSINILVISESPFLQEVIKFHLHSRVNYIYFAENVLEAADQINHTSINFHWLITDNTIGGVSAVDFIPHFIISSSIVINGSASDGFTKNVCILDSLFTEKELINCLNTRPIVSDANAVPAPGEKMDSTNNTSAEVSVVSVDTNYYPVVEAFCRDLQKNMDRMAELELAQVPDREEVRKIAHSLKGTSRSFKFLHQTDGINFFETIADLAASIETSASDGSENITKLVEEMKEFAKPYRWISR